MTYWNYRVVNVEEDPEGEPFYEVCEVFYDENEDPAGWCKANVCGENLEEVVACMKMMARAFDYDELQPEDFIGKYYEGEIH